MVHQIFNPPGATVSLAYPPGVYDPKDYPLAPAPLTLQDALDAFLLAKQTECSPKTVASYRLRLSSLVAFLGDTPLETVTLAHLRAWQRALKERPTRYPEGSAARPEIKGGLSPITIKEHIRNARIFFNWLEDEELLDRNPARRLKLPKAKPPDKPGISTPDLNRMVLAAELSGKPRDYAILLFFRDTRCRLGGAIGLTLKTLWVERLTAQVTEKGGKTRFVYFLEETGQALEAWLKERPQVAHPYVFTGERETRYLGQRTHAPLGENGFHGVFQRYAENAKVKGAWNPHAWRHWGARQWAQAGMPDSVRAQLLGHSLEGQGVTAGYYSKLDENKLREMYFKYTAQPLPYTASP